MNASHHSLHCSIICRRALAKRLPHHGKSNQNEEKKNGKIAKYRNNILKIDCKYRNWIRNGFCLIFYFPYFSSHSAHFSTFIHTFANLQSSLGLCLLWKIMRCDVFVCVTLIEKVSENICHRYHFVVLFIRSRCVTPSKRFLIRLLFLI